MMTGTKRLIKFALLSLLPSLVAGIQVLIEATGIYSDPNIVMSGYEKDIISDVEINTFGLYDDTIKNAVATHIGRRPEDVFLRSPTPPWDLYRQHNWDEVSAILRPTESRVLRAKSEPVIITIREFINNSSYPGTYRAEINEDREQSTSTVWQKSAQVSLGQSIQYKLDLIAGGGGETSLTFTGTIGQDRSESRTVRIGTSTSVEVHLEPGQSVEAILSAKKGVMHVELNYEVALEGGIACNFYPTFAGHYFWWYNINSVLDSAHRRKVFEFTEVIKTDYYYNARVELRNRDSDFVISSVPASIYYV